MDVGTSVYGKTDLITGTDRPTFSTTTYRTAYMFSPSFKPAENRTVPSHVHTNPHFFSFNESAFRPHETSESAHQNRIFTHITRVKKVRGLKNFRISVDKASKASIFRVSERFSYEKVFVICFISQWMKRSKDGLFVFPPKKTLIWRRHCSIGQTRCSMTSKRSIVRFLESSRA